MFVHGQRNHLARRVTIVVAAAVILMSVLAAAGADPYLHEAKLVASDGHEGASFGSSLAVSGEVAVIGASWHTATARQSGAVYVFRRSGQGWVEEDRLIPPGREVGGGFGWTVAVDGDTIAVGDVHGFDVHVYTRVGDDWRYQVNVMAGIPSSGAAHTLAVRGDTLAAGDFLDDTNGEWSGAVHVFTRSGDKWSEQAKLIASDGDAGDLFGRSLALEPDRLLVGAPNNPFDEDAPPGAAYLFERVGSAWVETAKLMPADGHTLDEFGRSVAFAGDSVVVGSAGRDQGGTGSGAVHVFDELTGGWEETARFAPPSRSAFQFGVSVAAENDTIVVGTLESAGGPAFPGSAHVYRRVDGTWARSASLVASDGAPGDHFGTAVGLTGETVLVGARGDDPYGGRSGSVYVFDLNDLVPATRTPEVIAGFNRNSRFASGTVSLTGFVIDDVPVRWVKVAVRDRITRLWLQDDLVSWGSFNRFDALLEDPTAPATTWSFNVDLPDGDYALSVRTKDRDGNVDFIRPWRRFRVGSDWSPPALVPGFAAGAQFESPVSLTGDVFDHESGTIRVRVAIRNRATRLWLQDDMVSWGAFNRFPAVLGEPGAAATTWTFEVDLPPGDYSLSARATDRLGNESSIRPWRHFSVVG